MKTTLTAKLKLLTTPDQFQALRATILAYRAALNYVSAYSFAHRKTSSGKRLQRATYADLRRQFDLPAQMACNVPRQVGATYQALWTKARKNAEARRLGYIKRRFKGLDQAPHYVSPTLTYNLGRDYSLRTGQQVSLLTLAGRIHVPYQGWNRHVALLQEGALIGGSKLWYDRGKQRFFLLVSLTIETSDPTPEDQRQVLGVDVGQRYLATVATLDNGAQFYSGKEIRAKADHYARLQKRLRAARHSLSHTATHRHRPGRRDGGPLNTNHTLSKRILDTHPHACIGLEELSGIRDHTKRKHGKKATKKQRRANRHASKWAFAELHELLAYKAVLAGQLGIKVDADERHQTCPRCGFISRENRPRQGLLFVCQQCGYTLHADLVGARNIALRTLVIRQDGMATGKPVSCP